MILDFLKYFKFKCEIGISEIIAFIAILISVYSLYQSNKALDPYMVLGLGDSNTGIIKDTETGECLLITQIPVILNNSGNKSALIKSISLPNEDPVSIYSFQDKMLGKNEIRQKLFLLQGKLQYIQDWEVLSKRYAPLDLKRPITLQKIIPPNSSYGLNFLLSSEIYKNDTSIADRMYVGINIEDENEKTYEVRLNIGIPQKNATICK